MMCLNRRTMRHTGMRSSLCGNRFLRWRVIGRFRDVQEEWQSQWGVGYGDERVLFICKALLAAETPLGRLC